MNKAFLWFLIVVLIFCGCNSRRSPGQWGSFTFEKTFSYDGKYYAVQKTTQKEDTTYIQVEIYTSDDALVTSFQPARARDFWGICWEKDTYNLWIQSGDVGVLCYSYENGEWLPDLSAVRPDDVISKYDS